MAIRRLRTSLLLLPLLLLATAAPAAAEPLAGTVLDGKTFRPVAGAIITVEGTALTAQTDRQGRYRFADVPPGILALRVAAAGYESDRQEFRVEPQAGLADAVIVLFEPGAAAEIIEFDAIAPEIKTAPGQAALAREELTKLPGSRGDALNVVKSLPGVANVNAFGPGAGLLVIRGAAPEDSKVLLDGVEVPILYHFFGLQSIVPSEFIDSLEFRPGGFGAEEGRATGGIIEIKTRRSRSDRVTGFAEVSFINLAGFLEGPISKSEHVDFTVAFRRSLIDFILPAAIPDDVGLDFTTYPQYYDGQFRLDWRPAPRHQVTLLGLGSFDLLTLFSSEENANDPELAGLFETSTSFTRAIASWKYAGPRFESRLSASGGTGGFHVEIGRERFFHGDGYQATLREDARVSLLPQLDLRAGADVMLNVFAIDLFFPLPPQEGGGQQPSFTNSPNIEFAETIDDVRAAGYVAADVRPTRRLTVTPGVRYDYYGRIDRGTVSPRLSVAQELRKDLILRGALGSYSRPLEQNEAISTTLLPELATQYVAGADYTIAPGLTAAGSAFYTERRHLIVQDPALAVLDPLESYINRGYGASYGAEALVRVKRENWFGWVAYTLSRSERVDGYDTPERLFDYDQTHNFLAVGSARLGKWELGGRWQLSTGAPVTPVDSSRYIADTNTYMPVFGAINSDRLTTSHQLDLRADRRWQLGGWTIAAYLDITNVYANARVLGYQYNHDFTRRDSIKDLPILPAIGVRGTF